MLLNLVSPLRAGLIRTKGKFGDGAKRVLSGVVSRKGIAMDQGSGQCKSLLCFTYVLVRLAGYGPNSRQI